MNDDKKIVLIDFETRSFISVKDTGAWAYAEHPTTEIMCMGYKIDDGRTKLWTPDLPFPQEIIDAVEEGAIFEAHNVQFERAVWYFLFKKKLGIPMPKRWRDTLAVCAYRGMPLGLDQVGKALNLPIVKDKHGKYLLQTLSIYKGPTKKEPNRVYREDWDLTQDLYEYCMHDIDSEKCLGDTLGVLPPSEQGVWVMDQRINSRGLRVDLEAIDASMELIEETELRLHQELNSITEGKVTKASQRDKLLTWLRSNGLNHMENLTKETLENTLEAVKKKEGLYKNVDEGVQRVLEIRTELARASTKKLERMKQTVSSDGRIRGLMQYHGASTGRWAGRLVQPHNFPRGNVTNSVTDSGKEYLNMELLADHLKSKDVALIEETYGSVMSAISSSLRGMFIPDPDKRFYICDFSAIEARVVFWVADCLTGLEVFHKSDRGESEDIYCVTSSDLVGFEVTKANSHERQLGKITVLGCGYQMGAPRLKEQAEKDYKVDLTVEESEKMVNLYREKYQEVKWLWWNLQEAAIETVKTGKSHRYRKITYHLVEDEAGRWLACELPNGRCIWYYEPVVELVTPPWGGEKRDSLIYQGRDSKRGGAWGTIRTYGGMLTENVVQAIARDLMAEAMIRVEMAGYPVVLTVHDEIIAEVPKSHGSQEEFEELMAGVPAWAEGCPIAVEGGVVDRYQKI